MNTPLTFEQLEKAVIKWATERAIFQASTPLKQLDKTQEELLETRDAIVEHLFYINNREDLDSGLTEEQFQKIVDGFGDTLVTLINAAHFFNISLTEALGLAFEEIKNRTGSMVNGNFVKDQPNK
jgi:NTP pyrophosphatase (non-canonical NTP hydrolase)